MVYPFFGKPETKNADYITFLQDVKKGRVKKVHIKDDVVYFTVDEKGYTMQVDQAEKHLMNRDELLNRIATLCGGRATEEVMSHTCTTGASNDIEKASQIAPAMMTTYGMSSNPHCSYS